MPEDVAAAVAYLVSDQAGFISGQTINVDGGWAMH
jgi:NAD(P)-dependent dehydrogenase (short-subunit alcohol dehydrogenase family)